MAYTSNVYTNIIRDVDECADLIVDSKQIVAIFQNDAEIGPRALGNRSILFDATNPNAKEIVNAVKKREPWRPFDGTILLEHVHDYFFMGNLEESPWMSFAIKAKPLAKTKVPSIVHFDDTCRIQTLTEEQNPNYYKLISKIYEKTGVPIVFNTSFNLAGEALVETIEDAIDTCNRSEINQLYIPEDQEIDIPFHRIKEKTFEIPD